MTTEVEKVIEEVVTARSAGTDIKELFGGPRDWIDASLPPAVAMLGYFAFGLKAAIWAAAITQVVIVGIRLVRRETLRHAFSGAFGVAISLTFAVKMHSIGGYFIPGIIINVAYGLVFLGSVLFGYPLVGVILKAFQSDKPEGWHDRPIVRRAYVEATLGWAAMFLVRAVVQETLRRLGLFGVLAVAKISMGYPLYLGVLALTLPYVTWRTRSAAEPEAEAGGGDACEQTA